MEKQRSAQKRQRLGPTNRNRNSRQRAHQNHTEGTTPHANPHSKSKSNPDSTATSCLLVSITASTSTSTNTPTNNISADPVPVIPPPLNPHRVQDLPAEEQPQEPEAEAPAHGGSPNINHANQAQDLDC